jgi:hypothetical protein
VSGVRDTLAWRFETEIAALARQYTQGSYSLKRWSREMERLIMRGYTAALLASTAERLNMKPDALMDNPRRMSRAERNDIKQAVTRQRQYLEGFIRDIQAGKLSPAQIEARARLYAGSVKPFYEKLRWGDWDIPDNLLPGNQECLGNCKCTIQVIDQGNGNGILVRTMGDEPHCSDCPSLSGDHPVKRRR